MFASQQVRLAIILAVGGLAAAAFVVAGWYEESRADSAVRRDRAAVEAAAGRLSYVQVADAWMRMKLFDGAPLAELKTSIGIRPRTIQEDGGAIILTFASGYGSRNVCLDLTVGPDGNSVHSRPC